MVARRSGGTLDNGDGTWTEVVSIDQTVPGTALSQVTTAITPSTAVSAKAAAGNVFALSCSNTNAAVRYLQFHNKASAPVNADVPVAAWPIPAGTANTPVYLSLSTLDFGVNGYRFATGVAFGISTTIATYTAATAAEHVLNAAFI